MQAGRIHPGRLGRDPRADAKAVVRPDPMGLVAPASRLPGKALHVGAVCWLLAGWERSARFSLILDDWAEMGLSRYAAARGLGWLAEAGLVISARGPRNGKIVTLTDPLQSPRPR
ncbi:MAG: hypothetical protein U0800_06430 [Isosphaeraceae bacterium]